ncbi:hybrid sensor histidine kinase/response regulator [Oryzifoliimicrobium ureilyticus]|uniref:hybrid sensor histidine kinase/response regulator n=1 Tax=Oryzifoliimicrobium ureilyticus TaxID=3113724 RepID=UPI00307674D5
MMTYASLREKFRKAFGQQAEASPLELVEPRLTIGRGFVPKVAACWLGGFGIAFGALLLLALFSAAVAASIIAAASIVGSTIAISLYLLDTKHRKAAAIAETKFDHGNVRLFAGIHDVLGDITVTRGTNQRIVAANETFRQLTGCLRPVGLTCEEIGIAFRPSGEPHRYHVEISTPDGQRIFDWHDVITRNEITGKLVIQSVARDVTGERAAVLAVEEACRKAEFHSAAKSRLLATVSHEIRTPLSGILGMTHLLAQTRLTREQESYLTSIRQSGYALTQLVEDLLDFSTIEVGRFNLRTSLESPRALLESVVEMLAHRAHDKQIEIGATFAAEIPERLDFDVARLRQVLFNVVGNAVKFTKKGGVLVRVGMDAGEALTIDVIDTGPGMTAEEQERVFEEFEQAGTLTSKRDGTGLGLSISARIIQEFGGSITVISQKGKGSTFAIRFPINQSGIRRKADEDRPRLLSSSNVILFAPEGPGAAAIAETIQQLGGTCHFAADGRTAKQLLDTMSGNGTPATDLIVDHRSSSEFTAHLAGQKLAVPGTPLRKIFLVNPEERSAYSPDIFDAWLIRPLREQSLIDVLRGRMHGVERRDLTTDLAPGLAIVPPHQDIEEGLDILVGEDDPINAILAKAILEKAGHKIRHVADFESLLDIALTDDPTMRPHIIITDLSMPGGDGKTILGRLRSHERRLSLPHLPIIVLTGDTRDETRRQVLLNGANRVIVKPVDPMRLLTEVRAVAAVSVPRAQAR